MWNALECAKQAGLEILNELHHGFLKQKLGPLQFDSRKIEKNEIFVAIAAEARDGHAFLEAAFDKGAGAALVSKENFLALPQEVQAKILLSMPVLAAKDSVLGMGALAAAWRNSFALPVIALSGSNGKTTTKDMLGHILQALLPAGKEVLFARGSFNNHIGVPYLLSRLTHNHAAAVMELGTNHFGEIDYLAPIIRAGAALVTSISESHLEYFGDCEGVLRAETEGLDDLTGNPPVVFVNLDDPYLSRLKNADYNVLKITYSLHEKEADYHAEIVKNLGAEHYFGFGIRFSGRALAKPVTGVLQIPGKHNVQNALAAFAAAVHFFKMKPEDVVAAFAKIQLSANRAQILPHKSGFFVMNDCYNANPGSMKSAIQMAADCGRFGCAFGEMKEIGADAANWHLLLGKMAVEKGAQYLGACGPFAAHVQEGALQAGLALENSIAAKNPEEMREFFLEKIKPREILLVKGSRGAQMERLIESLFR